MMIPALCAALLLPLPVQDEEAPPDQVRKLESACAILKAKLSAAVKRINELEASKSALAERIRSMEDAKEAGARKISEIESAGETLAKRIAELERLAQQAPELRKKNEALAERIGKAEGRNTVLQKKLQTIEKQRADAEQAAAQQAAVVCRQIRGVKQALLLSRYACEDGDAVGKYTYPNEDHFADLGIRYAYPAKGEGLKVVDIIAGGPAEQAGLQVDDLLLKVDGKPVKKSGLPATRDTGDEWVPRIVPPGYVTSHLPGDTVTVEVQRGEETLEVKATFGCRVCAKDCPFVAPAK
jgi:hypothetical protein